MKLFVCITSSPAASTISAAPVNFSFASPAPEDVSNGTMEGVSDPQPSPENLRQHQEDQSSFSISHNEDVVREDSPEPSLVLLEDKETAYEETESPGLDSDEDDTFDLQAFRSRFANCSLQEYWIQKSEWFKANWEKFSTRHFVLRDWNTFCFSMQKHYQPLHAKIHQLNKLITTFDRGAKAFRDPENPTRVVYQGLTSIEETILKEYRKHQQAAAISKFKSKLMNCNKPLLFEGGTYEEPCSSPALIGCRCQPGTESEEEE